MILYLYVCYMNITFSVTAHLLRWIEAGDNEYNDENSGGATMQGVHNINLFTSQHILSYL
jgi:hypothetical protein